MPRESSHFDEGLEKAHQALLEIMDRVGALIQRGETDGSVWRQVLHALHKRVWDHFEFEERNGYLETVLQREPGLRHRVEELLRQHDELRRGLSDLIHRLPAGRAEPDYLVQIAHWLGKLRLHEIEENTVVQDAFNLVLGGED